MMTMIKIVEQKIYLNMKVVEMEFEIHSIG